ncbi:hypothetical protein DBR27_09505 [Flavobacterium sp. HMWF030]|nr:hypothetical protein DBR27_09505 [Flavobacterium sp. HMWF030]
MKTKLLLLLLLANFSIYAQTNLVSNGDFESWTQSSQPTDWFRFTNGLLYQDSNAQHGASSTKMEITSGTLHFMNSSPFAIQLGKAYRVTMYHKLVSGTFSSVELSLTKNDAFKTTLTKTIETSTVNSEWRKIEFDYVATTTQNAEISILVTGTTGSQILIDNVSIVDVAELGPKYTLIPDVNFENALIEAGIDSGTADGKVLTSKVATVTNLFLSSKNIASLSGIEDFKALQILSCLYNQLTSVDISNNTNLTHLNIDGNKLTKLDIAKNTKLTELTCDDNQIASLDLSFTPLLTELSLNSNPVTSIDVTNLKSLRRLSFLKCMISSIDLTNNKDLTSLLANRNKLTVLNLSQNKELVHLDFYSNSLTALDVSANTKLEYLNISSNPITSIDLKLNINLKALVCVTTQISTLDLSNNKSLIGLNCQNNTNLTELNLKNGNNSNLVKSYTYWTGTRGAPEISSFQNNLKLSCIVVDDVAYANTNWSTLTSYPILFTLNCASLAYTLIPDANFEIKLMALGFDKDGKNGKVLTSSISTLTSLNVSKSNITDLTGIQDFKALTSLNCSENALTTLDVSSNVNLKTLTANKNQLKSINTSKNLALESFTGSENQFTALDFSSNTALLRVYATDNVLTSLNVSNNSKLTTLWCQRNKLPNLEISKNTALTEFVCDRNELETLNVSKNTALTALTCSENKLKSLDVSQNTLLKIFNCSINKLESLNVKNGNNTLLDPANLSFFSNLNLKCILVDDVAFANTNWSKLKDASATYNTDCTAYTLIPDAFFEQKLIDLGIDTDGKNGKVVTASIAGVKDLNLQSTNAKDLTGLEDFISLENLTTPGTKITKLNVTKNTALKTLNCSSEDLISLDLTNNINLVSLNASNNKFSTLNTSKNLALESLNLTSNTLTVLDIQNNINLTSLNLTLNTNLSSINVSKNTKLVTLEAASTGIQNLDITANTKLISLICGNSKLTSLDVSSNPLLVTLNCQNNVLKTLNLKNGKNTLFGTNLNFKNNAGLTCILVDDVSYSDTNWSTFKDVATNYSLDCIPYTLIPDSNFEDKLIALKIDKDGKNGKVATSSISSITSLDISSSSIKDLTGIKDFTSLTILNCSTNQITSLTPANNLLLTVLNCSANQLTSLNTTNNLLLTDLNCSSNLITSIDVSKNKSLTALNVSNNNLTTLNVKNGFNTNIDWFSVNFTKNASLSCIQVDNAKYSNDNWNGKLDKTSYFTEDCSSFTLIPDSNFEDKLIALKIDIDGKNGKVLTSTISKVTDLNVQLSDIKDLTGIQDFASLEFLNCQFNFLTSLNVTKNSKLIELYTHGNDLTALNVSANTALTTLQVNKNKLTVLDLSKNTKLIYVNVSENALKTLNLKNGNNTNFTTAFMFKNAALLCIQVDNASFATTSSVFSKDASASYSATCSLGIEDSVFDKVVMYPNPTKGEVNINNISLDKATVYNSLGQLVKSFVFNSGDTNNTINLSDLPKGIYYVYLISEDAASAKKVIVQ